MLPPPSPPLPSRGLFNNFDFAFCLIVIWNNNQCYYFYLLLIRFYKGQKKTLEINVRHPLIKKLAAQVEEDGESQTAKDLAEVLFETAVLRSGFMLEDSAAFAGRIERMLRLSMDIDLDEKVNKP